MVLALDIGASKIRIAEVKGEKIIDKKEVRNPKRKKQTLKKIFELIELYPRKKRDCICVGIAALLRNEKTIWTPNWDFENVNLKKILKARYKARVSVDNDANCAGLAELYFGQGKGKKNFVLLTLGTGIGGAVIIDSKLYHGNGTANEPGHMLIDGKRFEEIASGPASVKLAKKFGLNVKSLELESLAHHRNAKALKVYREIGRRLGIGMLNISYLLDPEIIILGGGFSRVEFIYKEAIKTFHKMDRAKRNIPVKRARLGVDAGLVGAGLLAKVKS